MLILLMILGLVLLYSVSCVMAWYISSSYIYGKCTGEEHWKHDGEMWKKNSSGTCQLHNTTLWTAGFWPICLMILLVKCSVKGAGRTLAIPFIRVDPAERARLLVKAEEELGIGDG